MAKIRIYELARKWKVDKNRLLEELNKRGHDVKSALGSVEESDLDLTLKELLLEESKPRLKKEKLRVEEPKSGREKEEKSRKDMKEKREMTMDVSKSTGESAPSQPEHQKSSGGFVLAGIALLFGVVASLISISATSQLNELKVAQKEISEAILQQSLVNNETSKRLDEYGKLINEIMEEMSAKLGKYSSLNRLRSQADILKYLASPPSEGADSESFDSWRRKERISGLEKEIGELLRDIEGVSNQE